MIQYCYSAPNKLCIHLYWFTLSSFFFNSQTGYSLSFNGSETTLNFDLVADDPSFKEKVWWILFKPFHGLFANKSLSVIKNKIMYPGEYHQYSSFF